MVRLLYTHIVSDKSLESSLISLYALWLEPDIIAIFLIGLDQYSSRLSEVFQRFTLSFGWSLSYILILVPGISQFVVQVRLRNADQHQSLRN